MERLPLFPLNTVLFPGMLLPLHVFEERYRLMIGRCLEEQAPFGVVLIRSGQEVGGPAEPHTVGTTARITHIQRLEGGRLRLLAVGERRFRIDGLDYSEPYLVGDVEYVCSEGAGLAEAEEAAHQAAALFGEALRLTLAVSGQWVRRIDLPGDPDQLADYVAPRLDVPMGAKQELLGTLSVPDRLLHEAELLGDRIRELTERWEEEQRTKFTGAALN